MISSLRFRLTLPGAVVIATLLLIAVLGINYSNNLLFTFSFMLFALLFSSFWLGLRNVRGLTAVCQPAPPVHVGQRLSYPVVLQETRGVHHYQLSLHPDQWPIDVQSGQHAQSALVLPASSRGKQAATALWLQSEWPLGLFVFRTQIAVCPETVVYPAAGDNRHFAFALLSQDAQHLQASEELAGLRSYVAGDTPKRIHWRALARNDQLQVREYEGEQGNPSHWLSWDDTQGLDYETRISCLTHWILECERKGYRFGLRLPAQQLAPDSGSQQRHRCLNALALLPEVA